MIRRLIRWWHYQRWLWDVGGGRYQNWWYARPRPIIWWRHRQWLKHRPPMTAEDIERINRSLIEVCAGPLAENLLAPSPLLEVFEVRMEILDR